MGDCSLYFSIASLISVLPMTLIAYASFTIVLICLTTRLSYLLLLLFFEEQAKKTRAEYNAVIVYMLGFVYLVSNSCVYFVLTYMDGVV